MAVEITQFAKDITPRRPMQPYHHSELIVPSTDEYLVKGLLDLGSFSVLYGASGCGKTFLALDLAWHITLGWDWFGLRVRQSKVYYLSAEGGPGSMAKRRDAFCLHHGINGTDAPLYICPTPADLRDSNADTAALIAEAKMMGASLIVIDTLSRVMAGGNENGPDDMGAFVCNVDRIRRETGAHVLVIHHSGKDEARGARGHSSLRAATDTEIEVSNGCVTVTKARDYAGIVGIAFKLESIELGTDDDGDQLTSCVVVPVDEPAPKKGKKQPRLPKGAKIALKALIAAINQGGEIPPPSNHIPLNIKTVSLKDWREYAYSSGISGSDDPDAKRMAFKRGVEALLAAEVAAMWNEQCWPCRTNEQT